MCTDGQTIRGKRLVDRRISVTKERVVVRVVEICFASGSRNSGEGRDARSTTLLDKFRACLPACLPATETKEKKRSSILTKVAISGADVIERGFSPPREIQLGFVLHFSSSRLPLSSSEFFLAESLSRKARLHLATDQRESSSSSLSPTIVFLPLLYHLLPPSASDSAPSINLFFSLRSSGPRNEQRKSIGWHCGFVPPASGSPFLSALVSPLLRGSSTQVGRRLPVKGETR